MVKQTFVGSVVVLFVICNLTLTFSYGAEQSARAVPFRVLPAKALVKVPRDRPFTAWKTDEISLSAARDETESFQLVVVPGTNELKTVTIKPCKLYNGDKTIPVEYNLVEYVKTIKPKNTKPEYVGWWPDILMPIKEFSVPTGEQQPVWVRINVPPDAAPGIYHGIVTMCGDGNEVSVPVTLNVRKFRIPRPGTLACPFGLYPRTLEDWYGRDDNGKYIFTIKDFARWCEFLGKYRLTPKNIGREYCKEKEDGSGWDLGNLKYTVGALTEKYYPPYSFAIYRLPNPTSVVEGKIKKDIDGWLTTLKQRTDAYQKLKLPEKVFLYGMDEASEECIPLVKETYTRIKEEFPDARIMQTLNHASPEQLAGLVDIWCPLSPRIEGKYSSFYKKRQKAGDMLWMYICCVPCETYANFFIDEPAIDHRILFWQAWQKGVTGFLYWSTTWYEGLNGAASEKPHFPDVPVYMRDTKVAQNTKNNGDGLLIWPGKDKTPYPSIRLEMIRDGIEDYEYLALLKRQINRVANMKTVDPATAELLVKALKLTTVPNYISKRLNNFTKRPEDIEHRRAQIGDMIEKLIQKR